MKAIMYILNGFGSMLSEAGKVSVKRAISFLFSIGIAYLVWFFLNKVVPVEKQATLRYLFTGLCVMILLLTGVATVKDIIALKSGKSDAVVEPEKSIAELKKAEPEKPITE